MTIIVGAQDYSANGTFTLTNGSQTGRCVVVVLSEFRNPAEVASATFNAVAPTANRVNPSSAGAYKTLISYWTDADLPAAAGVFNIAILPAVGQSQFTVFELSGWDEAAPSFAANYLVGNAWTNPQLLTVANSNAGAVILQAYVHQWSSLDFTSDPAQTVETVSTRKYVVSKTDSAGSGQFSVGGNSTGDLLYDAVVFASAPTGPDYTQRKGSTFDATHTLGTITTATLNGVAITINSTGAGTVNLTDTSGVTTSGVYNLVLGDGATTETYTVQVNVFGVVPSNNPAQKDGVALTSLTNVQVRITSGTGLNGVQRFYSPTEATDASGNFSTLDLSSSVAADADPVLMHVLTAAGDSIISSETVGLI
jgi:hypothetical protein